MGVRVVLKVASQTYEIPALWLREHSQEPGQRDDATGNRSFSSHDLPVDLRIDVAVQSDTTLSVRFSDGHVAEYDCDMLHRHITADTLMPHQVLWRQDLTQLPYYGYARLLTTKGQLAAITDLLRYGFAVITNVPVISGAVESVAQLLGSLHDVDGVRVFRHSGADPSIGERAALPTSANPFTSPIPGFQLFHCLEATAPYDYLTFVDALSAVDRLRREDPQAASSLASIAVTSRFVDGLRERIQVKPVIEQDHGGVVSAVNFHPMHDELPLMPPTATRQYHAARQRFGGLISREDFALHCMMSPGQMLIIDNSRILYRIEQRDGSMVAESCSVDAEGPVGRYRVLSRHNVRIGTNGYHDGPTPPH